MVSEAVSCPFPVTPGFARGFPKLSSHREMRDDCRLLSPILAHPAWQGRSSRTVRAAEVLIYVQFVLRPQGMRVNSTAHFYSANLLLQKLGTAVAFINRNPLLH